MKKKSKLQKVEQETIPVKYRIYPNKKQKKYLERCFWASRIVWNWLLGVQKDYDKGITEWVKEKHSGDLEKFSKELDFTKKSDSRKYHLEVIRFKKEENFPAELGQELIKSLIPWIDEKEIKNIIVNKKDNSIANKTLNIICLKRQIKFLKEEKPIIGQVCSEGIYHTPLFLKKAWDMCYDKNLPDFSEPKFKNRYAKQSFTFDSARLNHETGRLFLPPKNKKMSVKTKVHRVVEGEQKRVTVSRTKSGEYYASVNFRQETYFPVPKSYNKKTTVGIDLGIKDDYVIMSDNIKDRSIKNPKFFKKHRRKIAMLNRKLSRSEKGSNSRKRVLLSLNKEYEKLSKSREDFQHKVSHSIVNNPSINAVAVEDLNVKGMTAKNNPKEGKDGRFLPNNQCAKRGQNRATLDAGFGSIRQKLEYKCKRVGKTFGKVDRFYASSKTCNNCDHIHKELKVSDQYWTCEKCGEYHERNFNAANNVRDEFVKTTTKKKIKKKK